MKSYLQDMKKDEVPKDTFHLARWHRNGKLWISPIQVYQDRSEAELAVDDANSVPDYGGARPTPYFVWNYEEWSKTQELQTVTPSRSNRPEPL